MEFKENNTIKFKIYSFNYKVKKDKHWPIIVIIYNKYIFSINNRVQKA